jgi:predicted O-methyltransferase YrrM
MHLVRKASAILHEKGFQAFLRKIIFYIIRIAVHRISLWITVVPGLRNIKRPLAIRRLRKLCWSKDIDKLVNSVYSFESLGINIKPGQVKEEITGLLEILEKLRPKNMLEIGTANGGTLFLFARVADPNATIISIDLPHGKFGGGYPLWRIPMYRSFASDRQRICLIRADSHDPSTVLELRQILKEQNLDFLFIDGDHTYEGVKKDFEMYSPLVKKGGVIAFHDIVPGPEEAVGGVPRFWIGVSNYCRHLEAVKSWKQRNAGIGILFV